MHRTNLMIGGSGSTVAPDAADDPRAGARVGGAIGSLKGEENIAVTAARSREFGASTSK